MPSPPKCLRPTGSESWDFSLQEGWTVSTDVSEAAYLLSLPTIPTPTTFLCAGAPAKTISVHTNPKVSKFLNVTVVLLYIPFL